MSTIKEHIDKLFDELNKIQVDGHITQADEFLAFNEIDLSVNKLRKTCEQTKDIERQ